MKARHSEAARNSCKNNRVAPYFGNDTAVNIYKTGRSKIRKLTNHEDTPMSLTEESTNTFHHGPIETPVSCEAVMALKM